MTGCVRFDGKLESIKANGIDCNWRPLAQDEEFVVVLLCDGGFVSRGQEEMYIVMGFKCTWNQEVG